MTNKLFGYLGFAAKSRNMVFGNSKAEEAVASGKACFVLVAEDASESTRARIIKKCDEAGVRSAVYGTSDEISNVTGRPGTAVFCVTDKGFGEAIDSEIDRIRSEGE